MPETWEKNGFGSRDQLAWNSPKNADEELVVRHLQVALKKATPGRLLGLMAGIYLRSRDEAKGSKDETSYQQFNAVAQVLDHLAFAIDRVCPS